MNKKAPLTLALLICALSLVAFGQGKFPLKYEEVTNTNMSIVSMARLNLVMQKDKPADLKGIPKGLSENVSYASTPLGAFTLDLGSKPPKAYFDTNKNGDLSDEKPFEGVEEKGRFQFKEIAVGKAKFELNAWNRAGQPAYAMISPKGFLSGEAKLGESTYKIAFVDSTMDGKYDSTIVLPIQAAMGVGGKYDNMGFDFNGDGKIEPGYPVSEVLPLVKMLKLKDDYYTVAVAEDGSSVTMEKAKPEMGSLIIGSGDVEMMLYSECGQMQLKGSKKYDLPAGQYQLMSALLKTKDKDGVEWTLNSLGGMAKSQIFEITAGKSFEMKVGPPLTVKPTVTKNGEEYAINVTVTGAGGEVYLAGALKNNAQEPAPKATITDEKGKVLDTGDFKYG